MWYAYFFIPVEGVKPTEVKSPVSPQFLARAAILERIKIDTEFFKSAAFIELRDGVKLPPAPELRGRTNPFGPY